MYHAEHVCTTEYHILSTGLCNDVLTVQSVEIGS
jgi:hypothetical protein